MAWAANWPDPHHQGGRALMKFMMACALVIAIAMPYVLVTRAEQSKLTRSVLAYARGIMVCGAIVVAVGIEEIIAHPGGAAHLPTILVAVAGPLIFLTGNVLFRRRIARPVLPSLLLTGLRIATSGSGLAVFTAGLARATQVFTSVWLLAALVNMTVGVVGASYTVMQVLPMFVLVFAIPAAVAWLLSRRIRLSLPRDQSTQSSQVRRRLSATGYRTVGRVTATIPPGVHSFGN